MYRLYNAENDQQNKESYLDSGKIRTGEYYKSQRCVMDQKASSKLKKVHSLKQTNKNKNEKANKQTKTLAATYLHSCMT